MLLKTMSRLLMAAGLLAVLVSLGADLVGIGSKGIHAAQFLGALAGFGLFLLGAWLTEAYKGSFNTIVGQQGVDGVIKTLQDRNRQLANAKN